MRKRWKKDGKGESVLISWFIQHSELLLNCGTVFADAIAPLGSSGSARRVAGTGNELQGSQDGGTSDHERS